MKISKKLIVINLLFLILVVLLIIRLFMYSNLTNKLNYSDVNSHKYHCLVRKNETKENDVLISTLKVYNDITVDDNYAITNISEYYLNNFMQDDAYNRFKKGLSNYNSEIEEDIFNDNELTIKTIVKKNNRYENIADSKVWIEDYLSNYSNPVCERVSTYE